MTVVTTPEIDPGVFAHDVLLKQTFEYIQGTLRELSSRLESMTSPLGEEGSGHNIVSNTPPDTVPAMFPLQLYAHLSERVKLYVALDSGDNTVWLRFY